MKRTLDERARNTLAYLERYALAIKNNESVALAACNAHFAIKMFARVCERTEGSERA